MKTCRKCGVERPLDNFPRHKQMGDGHLHACRLCCNLYSKAYKKTEKGQQIRKNQPRNREWDKRYKNSDKGREAAKRYKVPKEQMAARNAVRYALRTGKLVRKPCEVCGEEKSQAHHWSYEKSHKLDVQWLCHPHHNLEHRRIDGKRSWV